MRNNGRDVFFNGTREYKDLLSKRNLKKILQYRTPTIETIDEDDYDFLTFVDHTWKTGDRFYKLANTYYNEPKFWWIIALINEKPTESHCKAGDSIMIPTPLTEVLSLIQYS
jgi:hypothetical protein